MPLWKLDKIFDCLRKAGAKALELRLTTGAELKQDHTVVTVADREIEAMLTAELHHPECGVHLIGEESIESRPEAEITLALQENCFVVDPIDGTAPYSADVPLWGISIGFLEGGVLTEGAIYMPALDEAIASCRGTMWLAKNLQSSSPEVTPFTATPSPLGLAGHLSIGQFMAKNWTFQLDNQIFAWSATVGTGYYLLKGGLLACILANKLWDLAGILPLLKVANFDLRLYDGRPFDFRITSSNEFNLAPDAPKRWRLKQPLILAPNREATEYLLKHITSSPWP